MEHKTNKNTNNNINVEIDKNTDRNTNIDKEVVHFIIQSSCNCYHNIECIGLL